MSIFEGKTTEEARNEVNRIKLFIKKSQSIIFFTGLQEVYFYLHNWIRLLANCTDYQFCLCASSQPSYLRFLRITHLDDIFGIHEG